MAKQGITGRWANWAPYFLSILRIVAAAIFMQSGMMKLFNYPIPLPPEAQPLQLMSQVGLGGILEFFGGALILLGALTRPVAFILSGMMAVAYFQFHAPKGFWPLANGGNDAVLFCFIWLFFSAIGAGPWSLDAALGAKDDR